MIKLVVEKAYALLMVYFLESGQGFFLIIYSLIFSKPFFIHRHFTKKLSVGSNSKTACVSARYYYSQYEALMVNY